MRFLSYWTLICLLIGLSLGELSAADTQQAVAEIASGEEMHAMEGADGHGGAHAEGEHHGLPPAAVAMGSLAVVMPSSDQLLAVGMQQMQLLAL